MDPFIGILRTREEDKGKEFTTQNFMYTDSLCTKLHSIDIFFSLITSWCTLHEKNHEDNVFSHRQLVHKLHNWMHAITMNITIQSHSLDV